MNASRAVGAALRPAATHRPSSSTGTGTVLAPTPANAARAASYAGPVASIAVGSPKSTGVIVGWAYSLDWLAYRVPLVARFVQPRSVPLVRDSRPIRDNLARENITDEELRSQLRKEGVDDLAEVREVILEGDGQLSVVRKDEERPNGSRRRGV